MLHVSDVARVDIGRTKSLSQSVSVAHMRRTAVCGIAIYLSNLAPTRGRTGRQRAEGPEEASFRFPGPGLNIRVLQFDTTPS